MTNGLSGNEIGCVSNFLQENLEHFVLRYAGTDYHQAVRRVIDHLNGFLGEADATRPVASTIGLVIGFYSRLAERVRDGESEHANVRRSGDALIGEIISELETIKIFP